MSVTVCCGTLMSVQVLANIVFHYALSPHRASAPRLDLPERRTRALRVAARTRHQSNVQHPAR